MSEPVTAELHAHHRDVTGGPMRAATFGVMDGLVSNFALLAGVAGTSASASAMALTGVAGLVAGACSMAVGEYVSVRSQTELMQDEIDREKREIKANPEGEQSELVLLLRAKGLSESVALIAARELSANPEHVWRTHVREELGVDPDDLPSPWVAAGSSFVAFCLGAALPVLPYLLGYDSMLALILISAVGLVLAGAVVAHLTARSLIRGALRQLVLGSAAAAVTFVIGTVATGGALG